MNSNKLFKDLSVDGDASIEFEDLSIDSRRTVEGDLFIAVEGHQQDGHQYIPAALESGASGLLIEKDKRTSLPSDRSVPVFQTEDTSRILPALARNFYGNPSDHLLLVGVTGTNGKTTTSHLLESILQAHGHKTGLIGTITKRFQGEQSKGNTTTPSIVENYRRLRSWNDRGADAVVIEASSHGLEQGRLKGIQFDVGIFTNLSRDHLDYHDTMENYFKAKRILADQSDTMIAFSDDEYGQRLVDENGAIGVGKAGNYQIIDPRVGLDGVECRLSTPEDRVEQLVSPLTGLFNYKNISIAAAAAAEIGVSWDDIRQGLANRDFVPGRCERLEGPPSVIVDYAHTPDAMENVITSLKPLVPGRLICVFGAGGDRDRKKRPMMGSIASREADYSVVTSDNPRSEPIEQIIEDILEGMNGQKNFHVQSDRGQAIREAIEDADEDDMVLIVGKGHETEQVIGDQVIPFQDAQVAREVLKYND